MVTSAFPQDSEVPVFQKSQVFCHALSLQNNLVFHMGFYQDFDQGFYQVSPRLQSPIPAAKGVSQAGLWFSALW
jgi:hypothetical protein